MDGKVARPAAHLSLEQIKSYAEGPGKQLKKLDKGWRIITPQDPSIVAQIRQSGGRFVGWIQHKLSLDPTALTKEDRELRDGLYAAYQRLAPRTGQDPEARRLKEFNPRALAKEIAGNLDRMQGSLSVRERAILRQENATRIKKVVNDLGAKTLTAKVRKGELNNKGVEKLLSPKGLNLLAYAALLDLHKSKGSVVLADSTLTDDAIRIAVEIVIENPKDSLEAVKNKFNATFTEKTHESFVGGTSQQRAIEQITALQEMLKPTATGSKTEQQTSGSSEKKQTPSDSSRGTTTVEQEKPMATKLEGGAAAEAAGHSQNKPLPIPPGDKTGPTISAPTSALLPPGKPVQQVVRNLPVRPPPPLFNSKEPAHIPLGDMQRLDKISLEGAKVFAKRQKATLTDEQITLLKETMKESFIEALNTAQKSGKSAKEIADLRSETSIEKFMAQFPNTDVFAWMDPTPEAELADLLGGPILSKAIDQYLSRLTANRQYGTEWLKTLKADLTNAVIVGYGEAKKIGDEARSQFLEPTNIRRFVADKAAEIKPHLAKRPPADTQAAPADEVQKILDNLPPVPEESQPDASDKPAELPGLDELARRFQALQDPDN